MGDLASAAIRSARLVRVHPHALPWVVSLYEDRELDGIAQDWAGKEELLVTQGRSPEQIREALGVLLRQGVDFPDMTGVFAKAEALLGNQDWVGGEWAAMTALAMEAGEFQRASRYTKEWLTDSDDLTPRIYAALAQRQGEVESRDAHLAEAAQRVSSAEEAQLFAEALVELRREETGAKEFFLCADG